MGSSYKYTKYANRVPVVEKYIGDIFNQFVNTNIYDGSSGKKYNYFVLDPSSEGNTSYVLRVYENIKKYQVFSCGAGGHGGIIYGSGGQGGNYLYINNLDINETDNRRNINIGSYLIIPGKAIDILDIDNNADTIKNRLKIDGNFYFIKYSKNDFINFKSLSTIDNYKKKNWSLNTNTTGIIMNINNILSTTQVIKDKVYEIILYLKKNQSFKFNDFKNLIYTRIIKISNNNNINLIFTPDENNNYTYTADDFDEIITIIFYQNSNETLNSIQLPVWSDIFDIDYAKNNSTNFYINDFINNRDYVNSIGSDVITNNSGFTYIVYDVNPDTDYNTLRNLKNTDNYTYTYSIESGTNGNICFISTNRSVSTDFMLKRYYMPSLFALNINLSGGNTGTTYIDSTTNNIISKLGGNNINRKLTRIPGRIITVDRNTNEWLSGAKGYYSDYFKLYAYYPYDNNIEMNNTTLANGGYTGYWQFVKDNIDYNYGANGLNNLKSPFYGTYGCGGQGGSVLLDKNSNFTGSKGKDGVFILSFLNEALSTIINDNSIIIKKMLDLFGINNNKLASITSLTNVNSNVVGIDLEEMINNLFIHEGNIHIDDAFIANLDRKIPKENFNILLAVIFIIRRIYYVLSLNLDLINIDNIRQIQINFVNAIDEEKISGSSQQLLVYVCDNINDYENKKYIIDYFRTSTPIITKYRQLLSLQSINTITIIKDAQGIKANIDAGLQDTIDTTYITESNTDVNKYLITLISYIFEIQQKDLKIHINILETVYHTLCLNAIIYVIIYHSSSTVIYTDTVINNIYKDLIEYNNDLKKITDKIEIHNNVFEEQNEFKLYFNNSINNYNDYHDKNVKFNNLLVSKKAYTNTKRKFRDIVNIFTLIIFIIVIIMIVWVIYVIIFNSNAYDAMPHLLLMALILIIIVIIIHYFNYSYSYKEFFINENDLQLEIINDREDYEIKDVSLNNENYKITFIKSNSRFILHKNIETSIILINKGTDATDTISGIGGTINIYDHDFVATNIRENERNTITIDDNEIRISDIIKTNSRVSDDDNAKIKIFYNNNGTNNNSGNYSTLINYFNSEINSNNFNLYSTSTFSNIAPTIQNNVYGSLSDYSNISTDVINNPEINNILNVILNTNSNLSSYYYGSPGNMSGITKSDYPYAYGLGGTSTESNRLGIQGICIIINKQVDFSPIHSDAQTLINMYNNNLNKFIYDKFNKIYLIDNNVIYSNALIAFRKRYDEENVKNDKYKKYETNINQYSMNILTDVYFRYEITKIFIYIFLALIICVIIYVFNKKHLLLILIAFILIVIFLISYFYFNMNINTRRDYYKYYWSKYNND